MDDAGAVAGATSVSTLGRLSREDGQDAPQNRIFFLESEDPSMDGDKTIVREEQKSFNSGCRSRECDTQDHKLIQCRNLRTVSENLQVHILQSRISKERKTRTPLICGSR